MESGVERDLLYRPSIALRIRALLELKGEVWGGVA